MADFLDNLNGSISYDDLIILAFFGTWIIGILCFFIGITINHFLLAIPFYIMADKAGYAYPFLAFIPFANYYLIHVLPIKEYNLIGIFKTYERKTGFWIFFVLKYIVPFGVFTIASVVSFIPFIAFLIMMVLQLISLAGTVGGYITKAIMMIDLFETYITGDKAIPIILGIAGLFIPLVFPITCYCICNKEPEFGYGNYYYPVRLKNIEE